MRYFLRWLYAIVPLLSFPHKITQLVGHRLFVVSPAVPIMQPTFNPLWLKNSQALKHHEALETDLGSLWVQHQ
jgi:hypothetical protein